MREALTDALADAGLEIRVATNGREALDAVRAFQPHVVLLDNLMPVMDGRQCLDELRADPVIARTPVVMISAERRTDARVEGADRVVLKPFTAEQILAAIDELTGG